MSKMQINSTAIPNAVYCSARSSLTMEFDPHGLSAMGEAMADENRRDVRITRSGPGESRRLGWISETEWHELVDSDPELQRSHEAWPPPDLHEHGTGRVLDVDWKGRPGVFEWFCGIITATDPDTEALEKMIAMAEQLGARVLGAQSEEYRPGGEVVPCPPAARAAELDRFMLNVAGAAERLARSVRGVTLPNCQEQARILLRITRDDLERYWIEERLDPLRVEELLAGCSTIDARRFHEMLFHIHVSTLMGDVPAPKYRDVPDEEVERTLFDQRFPIEWLIVEGFLSGWDRNTGDETYIQIEDNALFHACENYLEKRGRVLPSFADVREHARQNGWPGWRNVGR